MEVLRGQGRRTLSGVRGTFPPSIPWVWAGLGVGGVKTISGNLRIWWQTLGVQ